MRVLKCDCCGKIYGENESNGSSLQVIHENASMIEGAPVSIDRCPKCVAEKTQLRSNVQIIHG